MFRFDATRLRFALLAALVALSSGWQRVDVLASTASGGRPQTFEAATLVASLPLSLAPPLDPGLRLVALVASDIDADGDLDLVANDGSLDLLVWINDGSGHLTRRYARPSSAWREDASAAYGDSRHAPVSALASTGASLDPGQSWTRGLDDEKGSRAVYARSSLDWLLSRSQSPRAPPLSFPPL